jgi:hypothetical protein
LFTQITSAAMFLATDDVRIIYVWMYSVDVLLTFSNQVARIGKIPIFAAINPIDPTSDIIFVWQSVIDHKFCGTFP